MTYEELLESKRHIGSDGGFEPTWMPSQLYDFQRELTALSLRKGRFAIFADCGLGKTPMQLTWAKNVKERTGKPSLILTPLAVGPQTVEEGHKFGIEAVQSRDGSVGGEVTVTNYQQLHKFDPSKFGGVACDESSILKNFDGNLKAEITDFMRKVQYRLLCTATAAPNDYIELGTSSEALGDLGFMDMLSKFFKKAEATTSRSDEFRAGIYRFRGHAQMHFWRWVCSWSRALRRPSDMGFDDGAFVLPPLTFAEHTVTAKTRRDGYLIDLPAMTLEEQRDERRRTITERCEMAARLIGDTKEQAVAWCHLNPEGKLLEKLIPGAVEVDGSDSDEFKEETLQAFARGQIRVIVTKPQIAGWGLNWQNCALTTFFPSHSFEQFYQSIRRFWRFGQKRPVHVEVIASEGESGVLRNMKRKADQADEMFGKMIALVNNELRIQKTNQNTKSTKVPSWL